jgi:hypothetical protein
MRKTTIGAVASVALISVAYWLVRDNLSLGPARKTAAESAPNVRTDPAKAKAESDLGNRLLAALAQHSGGAAEERQAQMSERIAQLEAQLQAMQRPREERTVQPKEEQNKKRRISEGDLGTWIDDELIAGNVDSDASSRVRDQLKGALTSVSGVELAAVDCTTDLCRTRFKLEVDESTFLRQIYGLPSLMSEGFTLPGPDGQMMFYFTRPGTDSLDTLSAEASAARL